MSINLNSDFGKELIGASQEKTKDHIEKLLEDVDLRELREMRKAIAKLYEAVEDEISTRQGDDR